MLEIWAYALLSTFIVSFISFIGITLLAVKEEKLKKSLMYIVAFSAGALFGDAFIHLLPEIVEEIGFGLEVSAYLLGGIIFSFLIEKIIHWKHHSPESHLKHPLVNGQRYSVAVMSLFGDAVHNFLDGLIIGASYLLSPVVGIATTIVVIFHEIPQEIGNFGILLHGGFTKKKALFYNFLTALTAVAGAIIALLLSAYVEGVATFLVPFSAGGFIYIAGSDLIPELHTENRAVKSALQLLAFLIGIGVMLALILLE